MKRYALFFVLAALPVVASAQIPGTDWANLAQSILDNYRKTSEDREKINQQQDQLDQEAMLQAQRIDAWNNAVANAVVRMNQQRTDVHNLKVARDARPAEHACEPVSTSINLEKALCGITDQVEARSQAFDRRSLRRAPALLSKLTGETPVPVPPVDPDRPRMSDVSLDSVAALMGSIPSHDEALTTDVGNLIEVAFPPHQSNQARIDWSDEQMALEMQQILRAHLPRKAMESIAARRAEVDGVSQAGLLNAFAEKHYSEERLTHLATNGSLTEAAVWRERYTSRAFRAWRSLNEYELMLDQEAMYAVRLLEAVDGPLK